MTQLLIHSPDAGELAAATRFGGLPVVPAGSAFAWPVCRACEGAMQYLGRIHVAEHDRLVLVFQCHNDPGGCETWDPNAGANAAIVVGTTALAAVPAPDAEGVVRADLMGATLASSAIDDYFDAREGWADDAGREQDEVLGQYRGEPAWLQSEETPDCDCCGKPMAFLAQLEEGPDSLEEIMNFGGGSAYVFVCAKTQATAKFLTQC